MGDKVLATDWLGTEQPPAPLRYMRPPSEP
jgi:hypothetical protein